MLQVKRGPQAPLKIKSIRKASDAEKSMTGSVCLIAAGDGSDKPPC